MPENQNAMPENQHTMPENQHTMPENAVHPMQECSCQHETILPIHESIQHLDIKQCLKSDK